MKKWTAITGFVSLILTNHLCAQDMSSNIERQWTTSVVDAPHLKYRTFDSQEVGTKVSYHIYVPEDYSAKNEQRFPVLYWLHGSGGGLKGIPTIVNHFDRAIQAGKIPPMLIVFPDGTHSMWCNSKDGRIPVETVLIRELIPEVDGSFRTIAGRNGRMIEGFSMGGYGAARLGFKYHDIFGAVSILSAGPLQLDFLAIGPRSNTKVRKRILQMTYGGDMDYFKAQSPWVLAEKNATALRNSNMPIRLIMGDQDELLALNRSFVDHLLNLGLSPTLKILPNIGHNPKALLSALEVDSWAFYRKAFGGNNGD